MTTAVATAPKPNTFRDVLEHERWRMMNSFGHGPYKDGLVQKRIDEIDAQLATMGVALEA